MGNVIAFIALVISAYGLVYSYKIAQKFALRNEDKMLIDELLAVLGDMQEQASHFFLDNRKGRPNPHIYVANISSKISIANFIIYTLKNDRSILKSNIDLPFSDLYLYGTLDVEQVNKQKPENNAEQFANMDQAYLKCVSIIYQSFQAKYQRINKIYNLI